MSEINDLISEFNNMCGHRTEMADKAIEEYAALKARVSQLEESAKDVISCRGVTDSAWAVERLEAALKAGAK